MKPAKESTPAAAYIRVSSTKQLDGDGPERQRAGIQAFPGFTIAREFIDDISGTKADRPAFEAMLDYCAEHGITTILVDKTDRFTRDLYIGLQLIGRCATLNLNVIDCSIGKNITKPNSPVEKFLIQTLMSVAELNKNLLVSNMAIARKRIRDSGQKCDGRKGYHDDPNFPLGPEIIARAHSLRHTQKLSFNQIANIFNDEHIPTLNGGAWHGNTIRRITSKSA